MTATHNPDFNSVQGLKTVQDQIDAASAAAGREKAGVHLVAVSKVHGLERIRPVLEAGQRVFGENRVQEAVGKWPQLRAEYPDLTLHLIGPLQTNKIKQAVEVFDVIETVDREKLARGLAKEFVRADKRLPIFVQINTGEEAQKAGISPKDADAFITLCRDELDLEIKGLMCIPPVNEEPALHFALLAKIAERNGLVNLSMGMSSDFETAIAFGATHVRVGTAIFGTRPKPGEA
ncbi:YggS family pyridoxal phosphate-dependent enzyme [Magnetovibrio sp. PR-2]|uniref:YggS family pyridoxal phosphate-dependent enzyme n=1 Tax=Magnetovibrio sp. PR-2 TaxID=3120356 RepID=UPI002FCE048E